MQIAALRSELGLTQEAFANVVGLTSKGYVSELERAQDDGRPARCSVRVALAIEELSAGRIQARSLNPDVGLVEDSRAANTNAPEQAGEAAA